MFLFKRFIVVLSIFSLMSSSIAAPLLSNSREYVELREIGTDSISAEEIEGTQTQEEGILMTIPAISAAPADVESGINPVRTLENLIEDLRWLLHDYLVSEYNYVLVDNPSVDPSLNEHYKPKGPKNKKALTQWLTEWNVIRSDFKKIQSNRENHFLRTLIYWILTGKDKGKIIFNFSQIGTDRDEIKGLFKLVVNKKNEKEKSITKKIFQGTGVGLLLMMFVNLALGLPGIFVPLLIICDNGVEHKGNPCRTAGIVEGAVWGSLYVLSAFIGGISGYAVHKTYSNKYDDIKTYIETLNGKIGLSSLTILADLFVIFGMQADLEKVATE